MAFCPSCGAQIPAGATACPACAGKSAAPPAGASAAAPAAGLTDNVAGMLAYITIIPAIVFLVLEPYNKRRFIRFHSFQCIFLTVAYIALAIVLSIFTMIPVLGLIMIPVHFLIWIGALVLWIILLLKAYQGQMFKLPVIGDMAEKQAGPA
ncbi:MAG: DUF4870 domain-containing protein [Terriglobales bacterium]